MWFIKQDRRKTKPKYTFINYNQQKKNTYQTLNAQIRLKITKMALTWHLSKGHRNLHISPTHQNEAEEKKHKMTR